MIDVTIKPVDFKATTTKLERATEIVPGAFAAAVYLWGAQAMRNAQRNTPVATGYLRRSAWLGRPTPTRTFSMEGGFFATYAFWVEVRENVKHTVGRAHFLRDALEDSYAGGPEFIRRHLQRFISSQTTISGVRSMLPDAPLVGPEPTRLLAQRRRAQAKRRARAAARKGG